MNNGILSDLATFFKGAAMGAANVIPGVSGGTIAFITGIFERLINSLRSFDGKAIGFLRKFDLKGLAKHVDLRFLAALLIGSAVSILTIAKVLEWGFKEHPTLVWAFFFGLVMMSIPYVGKMVEKWTAGAVVMLVFGIAIAAAFALFKPAAENPSMGFLVICGMVAICSMIVPGLSGSFVLLILGNYLLVLGSISDLFDGLKKFDFGGAFGESLKILVPFGIGCVVGLIAFAHLLGWVFKNYHDKAVALLTGFVVGSLAIIWPWKHAVHMVDEAGELMLRKEEPITIGYDYFLPDFADKATIWAIGLIVLGAVAVWGIEKMGEKRPDKVAE